MRNQVRDRLRNLPTGERHGPKGAALLVEAVMMWEFGDEIINDPGFDEIKHRISATLCGEPTTNESFERMVKDLVARSGGEV